MLSLKEVEIIQIDRRYEGYRMRSHHREGLLLSSIATRGIDEPITGSSSSNNNDQCYGQAPRGPHFFNLMGARAV